ncbi:60S ribosomal subunit assembly/export protein [Lecanora helva]
MGPTRTVKSSKKIAKGEKNSSKSNSAGSTSARRISKKPKIPPPKQQKTKSAAISAKKKKRTYTDEELGIPKLNMITPVGVDFPKGKKKGKVFVDDQASLESMMTIFAIVNANKEGQIESKMMKSRQMEEIREARRKEAEARQEQKKSKLEETKDSMRKRRKRKSDNGTGEHDQSATPVMKAARSGRKSVSFA